MSVYNDERTKRRFRYSNRAELINMVFNSKDDLLKSGKKVYDAYEDHALNRSNRSQHKIKPIERKDSNESYKLVMS